MPSSGVPQPYRSQRDKERLLKHKSCDAPNLGSYSKVILQARVSTPWSSLAAGVIVISLFVKAQARPDFRTAAYEFIIHLFINISTDGNGAIALVNIG